MRTPPGLMGAAWLLWGWTAGGFWLGAGLAAFVEIARAVPVRWSLDDRDYESLWDILGIGFLVVAGFFLSSARVTERVHFLVWTPVIYLPMLLAQWWGPRERIPTRTLLWLLRRWQRELPWSGGGVDITWPFWALCLAAASVPVRSDLVLYAGLGVLGAWALAARRPRAWPVAVWLAALAVAWPAGWLLMHGLNDLQGRVEKAVDGWIVRQAYVGRSDGSTAIGRIGDLKGSRRIVWRVQPLDGPAPGLIRETAWSVYRRGTWARADGSFKPVSPEAAGHWVLRPEAGPGGARCAMTGFPGATDAFLPVPLGAAEVTGLEAWSLSTNGAGVVWGFELPRFVRYEVRTASPAGSRQGVGPFDCGAVPAPEREGIARMARELGLPGMAADAAIAKVSDLFRTRFSYRTWQGPPSDGKETSPLARFLFETRAGHCEYFATATVLLLRQAGLPARYVTGWAVHEADGRGGYVVRERDAHAWCEVMRNGVWATLDTTPPDWRALEDGAHAAWLARLGDAWAAVRFWAGSHLGGVLADRRVLGVAMALAVLWLGRRLLFRRRQAGAAAAGPAEEGAAAASREESVWRAAEELLARFGCGRGPGETPCGWLRRVAEADPMDLAELRGMLAEAYRIRYDPHAVPDETASLRRRIADWAGRAGAAGARRGTAGRGGHVSGLG